MLRKVGRSTMGGRHAGMAGMARGPAVWLALGAGAPRAVLSALFWRRACAADPGILGRTLRFNDRLVRVVGVMPESFLGDGLPVEIYLPIARQELVRASVRGLADRRAAWLSLVGR